MSIFDKFKRKDDERMVTLSNKVAELENLVQKSSLNESLVGIVNGNWHEIQTKAKNAGYKSHYAIYRGIDMLASLMSQPQPRLTRGEEMMPYGYIIPGTGFDITQPHPSKTFRDIQYRSSVYMFYRGEYILYINTEFSKDPILEVMNPAKLKPLDPFTWEHQETRKKYKDEDLIYVDLFDPDGERGLSPVEVIAEEIRNDIKAQEYNAKFFENFGRIGGTLSSDQPIPKERMEAIIAEFNRAHASSKNAYKTLGLPSGLEYKELQQTMNEMQFREGRGDTRDRVLQVLGIHKALFGVTDQVNRSVAEEASRNLWVFNLIPKLKMVEEAFNNKLFRRFYPEYRMEFDTSVIPELRENMETTLATAVKLRDLGYSLNEISEILEMMPDDVSTEIGDMRFIPNSLIPLDMMTDPLDENTDTGAKEDSTDKLLKYLDNVDETKASRNRLYNNFNMVNNVTAKKFKGRLKKFWSQELGDVVKIVLNQKSLKEITDINTLLAEVQNTLNANKDKLAERLKPEYESTSRVGDKFALKAIGSDAEPVVRNTVVEDMTNKIKGISDETYRQLRKTIKEAVNNGETIDDIAGRVRETYKLNNKVRSVIIARTETANMLNRSADARYKEAGVKKKVWLAVGDAHTRDTHAENYNLGPVAYDYVYRNGQMFPGDGRGGPAENINCRCTLQPIIE